MGAIPSRHEARLVALQDPVVALQQNVNTAGTFLSKEEKDVMKMEVPVALAHTNQLFEALAHGD